MILRSLTIVLALGLALVLGCSADDDSIENKECNIGPDVSEQQQCIKDYHCECQGPRCFCVPNQQSSLQQAVTASAAGFAGGDSDPSSEFLRRVHRLELH